MPLSHSQHASPDDRDWIAQIRAGDPAAFERLFRAQHRQLCGFAYRYVRSREVAQELVQDVFARLWADRRRLEVRESLKNYLYTSVRNHAISHLRHEAVERRWRDAAGRSIEHQPASDPHERIQVAEFQAAVQQVLDRLPPRCRLALILRWQRQMSYAEVAETMGLSVKTVEIYLTRGMAALRAIQGEWLPYR